jgi:hypothetical protein
MILAEAELKTKTELCEAIIRNCYYMISLKFSDFTITWMKSICNGKIWYPKNEKLRLRLCYSPPSKDSIVSDINQILYKNDLDTDLWLLIILITLHSRHAVFAKSYVLPSR